MLFLRTGLPGASKTLNTLKEICEDNSEARPIYYNNIKLLMLDFAVCESFSGYFYGHYFPALPLFKQKSYRKTLLRLHSEDDLASVEVFPHLAQLYDAWLSQNGHIELWLSWARRCYPVKKLRDLENYLKLTDTPTFDELSRFKLDWRHFATPTLWYELERNAIIVIDECQQWFPPRGPGSKVPRHCSEFETHRHKGYDIHLITQDAKLLDNHVRRLTGRHVHFFNPFSSNRVTRYQADKVFDPEDYHAKQKTQSKIIKRDKNFYGLYWSADVHTHKFKIPKKALLLIPIVIIVPLLVWIIISGTLIDSDPGSSPAGSQSRSASAVIHQQPGAYVEYTEDEPVYLPSALFSDGDHPLAGVCERIVYASRITQTRPRSVRTDHLLQCEIRKGDSNRSERSASRSDSDSDAPPRDEWEVFTMDSNFLTRLGYQPVFERGLFTLGYDNVKYIFPSM